MTKLYKVLIIGKKERLGKEIDKYRVFMETDDLRDIEDNISKFKWKTSFEVLSVKEDISGECVIAHCYEDRHKNLYIVLKRK